MSDKEEKFDEWLAKLVTKKLSHYFYIFGMWLFFIVVLFYYEFNQEIRMYLAKDCTEIIEVTNDK